jgi:hypothetical protein
MAPLRLEPVTGPRVWLGPEMAARAADWTHILSTAQIAELDGAVAAIVARDLDILAIKASDFALPRLDGVLRQIKTALHDGPGFALLKGVPVERYNRREAAIAYFGIGAYIGQAVSQNAKGHALGHVRDLGFDAERPLARGYQSASKLQFHTDPADVVGLLSLTTAKSGGLSSIVSSAAVFNAILETRPDLAAVLTQPVYRDRRDEIPAGCKPWYRMPVFNFYRGRLLTSYVRSTAHKAQRFAEVPRLTVAQNEGFDLIDALASSPKFRVDITFQPGDIQFLNNHDIMHSRTRYEDHAEPERRRHLLRLWLACADGPPLPAPYAEFQGKTDTGRPNGYLMAGIHLSAPLDAQDGGPGDSAQRRAIPAAP